MPNSTVTITYERHGTTPPIFVAGSFTEPAWQPTELDHRQIDKEYVFSKTFEITAGRHQYKFRVGHGDWWICDDTKDKEIDEAGNTNNIMMVPSPRTSQLGQRKELSGGDQSAELSTDTASEHQKSPSVGLDGVDDSDEELARSLRKEVALAENNMAEFHSANGDIEPDDSATQTAPQEDSKAQDSPNSPAARSATPHNQLPVADEAAVLECNSRSESATSKASPEGNVLPTDKLTKIQDAEEKLVSQKPSVSTVSARNGQRDQKDVWLIRLCRVVVQGVVGSMSTLLCGKRRKLFAFVLTALIIPVLAWTWRS